jgi:aspartyl-tRNA(Asn)/glutamyl-tRNA(Gln) amidotransferase subunit A
VSRASGTASRTGGRRLWELPAAEVAARVGSGEVSAVTVTEACLERTERVEPVLGAYLEIDREGALARAEEVDRSLSSRRRTGAGVPRLAGVPVAIKDNLSREGRPLTCGSRILEGYVAPYTATAVERLLAAGAVPIGRANLDELAMGSSCETSTAGPTRNPWSPDRVPGGSSGGSAAAVASSGVPLALGSDTGGSVRQPAALCGVVGLRPTQGRVSRWGLVAFSSSMDQVGPIARTVRDAALCLEAIAGPDPRDATCSDRPVGALSADLDAGLDGFRIGVLRELGGDPDGAGLSAAAREDFRSALERLADAGADVVEVSGPDVGGALDSALAAYAVLAAAEASSNLARLDGVRYGRRASIPATGPGGEDAAAVVEASRSEGFGAEVRRRILLGTFALSAGHADRYHGRARAVRAVLSRRLSEILGRVDVIAAPTAAGGAFPVGSRIGDPVAMVRSDRFTVPASLCGLPAISVPSGLDDQGLPLGLQLIGPAFGESRLLRAARTFERVTRFPRRTVPAEEEAR